MEDYDAIMAMWNLMGVFLISNAMYFAACAFLIWVGFRFTNNIYNNPETMLIGKVLTTLFCVSVAMFTFGNMAQFSDLLSDIAGSFAAMKASGVDIGVAAEELITGTKDAPVINLIQLVFLGSVILMQLAQIWIKK